jgi:hypothetical protein
LRCGRYPFSSPAPAIDSLLLLSQGGAGGHRPNAPSFDR